MMMKMKQPNTVSSKAISSKASPNGGFKIENPNNGIKLTRPRMVKSTKRRFVRFDFLNSKKNERYASATSVFDSYEMEDLYYKLIIAEIFKIEDREIRKFRVYDKTADFVSDVTDLGDKPMYFHEVILAEDVQKLKLDIEIKNPSMTVEKMHELMREIDRAMIAVFELLFDYEITEENITTTTASRPDANGGSYKHSYHKIITGYSVRSHRETQFFVDLLSKHITAEASEIIDKGVNKANQSFRVLGSTKHDGYYPLKVDITNTGTKTGLADLLLTETDDCVLILREHAKKAPKLSNYVAIDVPHEDIRRAVQMGQEHTMGLTEKEVVGNEMRFTRLEASHCHICNRTHDNDNTAVIGVYYREDCAVAYFRCMKVSGQKVIVGNFESVNILKKGGPDGANHGCPGPNGSIIGVTGSKKSALTYDEKCARREAFINGMIKNQYYFGDEKNLQAIKESNVYNEPQIGDLELRDTLFVSANMKLGKTEALVKYITKNFIESPKYDEFPAVIIFLTFRQTFAASIKEKFPEFVLYSDVKGKISAPKIIVQVESLNRLDIHAYRRPDLVVLDESESILQQFSSSLGRNWGLSWLNFEAITNDCKHLVCMDAFMSDRTYNVITSVRPGRNNYLHWNKYKNAEDYDYYFTVSQATWLGNLEKDLRAKKKIVVASTSLAEAKNIKRLIEKKFDNKYNIGFYSGATRSEVKKTHFSDVNKFWSVYDVLIYTPTVTAGVSFEKHYYDVMYAWFTDKSCDARICIQMMGRIRNLTDRRIVIGIEACPLSLPVTKANIVAIMRRQRGSLFSKQNDQLLRIEYDEDRNLVYEENNYFKLFIENVIIENRSRNAFLAQIINLIKRTGARMSALPENLNEIESGRIRGYHKGIKDEIRDIEVNEISNSPDLTPAQYERIKEKLSREEDLTEQERIGLEKNRFRTKFNWAGKIEPEFYKKYNKPSISRQYVNCRKINSEPSLDKSLKYIQRFEKEKHKANLEKMGQANECFHVYSDVSQYISYSSHKFAVGILRTLGLKSITESQTPIQGAYIVKKFADNSIFYDLMVKFCQDNNSLSPVKKANYFKGAFMASGQDEDAYHANIIKQVNKVLVFMYGIRIKRKSSANKVRASVYLLQPNELFEHDEAKIDGCKRPHIQADKWNLA